MSNRSTNRFGLFGASSKPLAELDEFAQQHHQRLLRNAKEADDVITRAKLLHSFHRAKPPTTENYLRTFIGDFADDSQFTETIELYREKLTELRQAKREEAVLALKPKLEPKEQLTLSKQQQAWHQLLATLKRCANNATTRETLGWHPHHHQNYYLAKLRLQWQRYEEQYEKIERTALTETLTTDIAEERRQTVIGQHVEAQQALMSPSMQLTPARLARDKDKLENEKAQDLDEIDRLVPQLILHTNDLIDFAQKPADASILSIFDEAIAEIQRHERSMTSSPALFNLATGPQHKQHALATLDKIDASREMMTYRTLFTAEHATITEALANTAATTPAA